jgi:hypothetical protein
MVERFGEQLVQVLVELLHSPIDAAVRDPRIRSVRGPSPGRRKRRGGTLNIVRPQVGGAVAEIVHGVPKKIVRVLGLDWGFWEQLGRWPCGARATTDVCDACAARRRWESRDVHRVGIRAEPRVAARECAHQEGPQKHGTEPASSRPIVRPWSTRAW